MEHEWNDAGGVDKQNTYRRRHHSSRSNRKGDGMVSSEDKDTYEQEPSMMRQTVCKSNILKSKHIHSTLQRGKLNSCKASPAHVQGYESNELQSTADANEMKWNEFYRNEGTLDWRYAE